MTLQPKISHCVPYYNNAGMLARHCAEISAMPFDVRKRMEFVVCDDASDVPARAPQLGVNFALKIFRLQGDHVPWSHRVCSNVATHESCAPWLLISDIDHLVSGNVWRALLTAKLDPVRVYTFGRENMDGSFKHSHPDSWLMHRDTWERIGGYDERYRGLYGQNAGMIDRVFKHAGQTIELPLKLIRVDRAEIPDASTPQDLASHARKSPSVKRAMMELRTKFKLEGTYFDRHALTVPYRRVFP